MKKRLFAVVKLEQNESRIEKLSIFEFTPQNLTLHVISNKRLSMKKKRIR